MALLAGPDNMYFVYENRLASFQGAHPGGKKRASNASSRAPKMLHWPHKSLSPVELAKAGFFFEPFPGSPDNVVCFLCDKSLDGWEGDDKPLEEHLKHSPSCGWAVMAAIEADLGEFGKAHPLDPSMIEARKATFGGKWPYESKKGFKCKTKQLAEAGWKYTPTLESDDMATCAYCHLALDGWESGDKPIEEHHKRSPDCPFFELIAQYPPLKKSRAKAVRASKPASRLSIQSVATVATGVSDLQSVGDVTADHDDSVMTTASVMTQGGKKATKAKKAPAAKGRKTRAKKDETVEILEDEPQDTQEPPPPQKITRGRKRASEAMEDSVMANSEAPAPKRRAARAKKDNATDQSIITTASQDIEITEAPPVKKPAAKKARGSTAKVIRKPSQSSLRSQASTASLRANVADDDINRRLRADLERPLTDDENTAADSDSEKPKALPVAKGRAKKATVGKINAKEQSQAYAMLDPTPIVPDEAEVEDDFKVMEQEMQAEEAAVTETLVVLKKGRKPGVRKASKQTKKAKEPQHSSDLVDQLMEDADAPPEPEQQLVAEPTPEPVPEPIQQVKSEPELLGDPDASTGTVVNNAVSRPTAEKRGRGRPKKSSTQSVATEQPEPRRSSRRSSGVPVQIEVQLESSRNRESFSGVRKTPEKITRKPVPPPVASAVPVSAPLYLAKAAPPSALTAAPPAPAPTPARTDKALPPPPLQPATRLLQRPTTPPGQTSPSVNAQQATISPSQSPQSSDAENKPPSSKPTTSVAGKRVVLAPVMATPLRASPSKRNIVGGLQSITPWQAVDLDMVFSPAAHTDKENGVDRLLRKGGDLTSPEKHMTVEEWIYHNAGLAEQKLKHECETMVTAFEREGTRAMRVLEGLIVE
ncbi:hypothetical protein B0H67DRAFT_537983 [Lasiosphaeris hirsuta]|uniref:Protein bir1 n=1 Tax=Lasiosphaeris hirsuta TaxID=260670 RepID=A0AA40AGR9_9PEZI|nr:hypothetical protein B0H67DRAFT_537983 [Lasiosphaeris hirsuta]